MGRTTINKGSKIVEDCSLPICLAGTYLNGSLNQCIKCKKGLYQPNSQQTVCLPCPPNTSTKGTGAVILCLIYSPNFFKY